MGTGLAVVLLGGGRGQRQAAPHHDPRLCRGPRPPRTRGRDDARGGEHARRRPRGRGVSYARRLSVTQETGGSRPRFLWGLFCDHFLVDVSGKYSFIGVFERIGAMTFPAVHKVMWIAFALRGQPNERAMGVVTVWSPQSEIVI